MAKKPLRSGVKSAVYTVMAFVLSLILFSLSFGITLEATLLNPDFIINNMNASSYFADKSDEITQSLVDLGYASGLEEKFFEGVVDELMINEDTCDYLESYYSGENQVVSITQFKQTLNDALDKYIEKNKIQDVNSYSRENFINKAATIYRSSLSIPLFSTLSPYFVKIKNTMPYLIAGLAVLALVVCAVVVFTNKWKHRATKYLCYAFSGATLSVGVLPVALILTGKISHINLTSRALYNLFVQCANSVLTSLLFCALFFLLVSVGLFVLYRNLYKKANR